MTKKFHVIITGANGFVGKNLCLRLSETAEFEVTALTRVSCDADYDRSLATADVAIHLAGVNRPADLSDFSGNFETVSHLVEAMIRTGCKVPVIFASSIKAVEDSIYGKSKKQAEDVLLGCAEKIGIAAAILRLPNVFGKWCRPNYNSAVGTFCHNVARDIPISVTQKEAPLSLLYIDDLMDQIIKIVRSGVIDTGFVNIDNVYNTTVGEVAETILKFHSQRRDSQIENVGNGLIRALYATYISYLPPENFSYDLVSHSDPRGSFSEMLRTKGAGQFSYFNAYPGVTRGGHYHHTKTEKFLVVHGEALFRFRNMSTNETHEIRTSSVSPVVVDTIPGWSHNITNVGNDILVCLLWANELFDPTRPDTVQAEV